MKKKKLIVSLLVASAAFGLASCTPNNDSTATATKTATATATQTATATATATTATATTATQQAVEVSFNTNGGSTVPNAVASNKVVAQPANPVKDNYAFAGWFADETFNTSFNFSNVTTSSTAYAKWVEVMSYDDVMAAEDGDEIAIGAYIHAKQSYDKGGTLYLVDETGKGYFGYQIKMTQDEFDSTFTVGTYAVIAGTRTSYSGEIEIASAGSVITAVPGKPAMSLTPTDVTSKIADLTDYRNDYFTATLTVKAYNATGSNTAAASGAYGYASSKVDKDGNPIDDLYLTLTDGTNDVNCCVERYLTDTSSATYAAVKALAVGDKVTVTGYMYWYNGANPHIATIEKAATQLNANFYIGEEDPTNVKVDGVEDDGDIFYLIKRPTDPVSTDEKFEFDDWYTDNTYTTKFNFSTPITEDTNIYGRFTQVKFDLNYNVGANATAIDKVVVNAIPGTLPEVTPNSGYTFEGWYKDAEFTEAAVAGEAITEDTTLYAKVTAFTQISSTQDLIDLISTPTTLAGYYQLTADLDFTGISCTESFANLTGTFDGQGHTISNIAVSTSTAKTGLLFAQVQEGTVKNIKFLGCSMTSTAESPAIVAGEVNGGSVINVEVNSCVVTTSNNYAGIIYGRSESSTGKTVYLEGITIKNDSSSSCAQYGGIVCGDNTANIVMKNCDITGTFSKSSNNYGLVLGRTRSASQTYVIENCIIDVLYNGTVGSTTGLFAQAKDACAISVKNVLIIESNAALAGKAGSLTAENVYYMPSASLISSAAGVTTLTSEADVTADWFKDTLKLDFTETWVAETNGGIRLVESSPNVPSEGAVVESIKIATSGAETRYKKGTEFSAAGLTITLVYDDGVQIVADSSKYSVNSTAFVADTAGDYEIVVTAGEVSNKYSVKVVEQTGFKVYDEFMTHTYVAGQDFSAANLVVKSVWSDGKEETLASADYSVNSDAFVSNTAGQYDIVITNGAFAAQTIKATVVSTKPTVVDNKIYINVDAASTNIEGTKVQGIETFSSLTSALEYLKACSYEESVNKVIYVADGTYEEKLVVAIPNVTLIGESRENTKITYSAVESTVNVVTGAQYGMDCATIQVNAAGFAAYNLSIRNDFDFINLKYVESSPQGIALTVNGDQAIFYNVNLYGNQDTIYLKNGRTYFYKSLIEGNVDFICGNGTAPAFFDQCEIRSINRFADSEANKSNNGYVTAMKADATTKPDYGYIFSNCDFTDDGVILAGSMSLGRPWGAKATVAYINCDFSAAYSTLAYDGKAKSRWFDMSGNSPLNADFVEFGSTGEGAITTAVAGGSVITETEAANYTIANMFAATNGLVAYPAAWNAEEDATATVALKDKSNSFEIVTTAEEDAISVYTTLEADLTYYVSPWNATNKEFTITIGDQTVISYANGVVTGLKAGETTITFAQGEYTKVITVTVTDKAKDASFVIKTAGETPADVATLTNFHYTGMAIEEEVLAAEINKSAPAGMTLDKIYVDAAKTAEFDFATELTASTELFVTWKSAAVAHNYSFDLSEFNAYTDKGTIASMTTNSFLTVVDSSKVTARTSGGACTCIENKDGNLQVTFQGTGSITISFASTSKSNVSRLGLLNSTGAYVAASTVGAGATLVTDAEAGSYEVGDGATTGSTYVTVTFTITEAGTYTITCPSGVKGRGARINGIEMVDTF